MSRPSLEAAFAWSKFWWKDYDSDPALRSVSLAAQGLWMRMLCLMAEGEPYGHLRSAGRPMVPSRLAKLVGVRTVVVERLLGELETEGVFSRAEDGTIVSRRLVREFGRRQKARQHGAKGGNPALIGGETPADLPDNSEISQRSGRTSAQPESGKINSLPENRVNPIDPLRVNPQEARGQKPEEESSGSLREPAAGAAGQGGLFEKPGGAPAQGGPGEVLHFADEAARVRSQLWGEGKAILNRVAPAMSPKRVGSLVGQLAKKFGGGIRGGTKAIQTLRDVEVLVAEGKVAGYAVAPTPAAQAAVLDTYILGMMHWGAAPASASGAASRPSEPPKSGSSEWACRQRAERTARALARQGESAAMPAASGPIIDGVAECLA